VRSLIGKSSGSVRGRCGAELDPARIYERYGPRGGEAYAPELLLVLWKPTCMPKWISFLLELAFEDMTPEGPRERLVVVSPYQQP
jgi:hypothetical protein